MTRRDDHHPPPVCELCDGTHHIEVTDHRRHAPHCVTPDTCTCHAVIPCPCVTPRSSYQP